MREWRWFILSACFLAFGIAALFHDPGSKEDIRYFLTLSFAFSAISDILTAIRERRDE